MASPLHCSHAHSWWLELVSDQAADSRASYSPFSPDPRPTSGRKEGEAACFTDPSLADWVVSKCPLCLWWGLEEILTALFRA